MLAMTYYSGQGSARDRVKAVEWWRKAAEQGYLHSQFWMGEAMRWGHGAAANPAEAAQWYRKAAEQGHPNAQASLGDLYRDGVGVPRSDADALRWYRASADQRSADGQYHLGQMIAGGRGTEKSEAEAATWYRLAADQGFTAAMLDLAELYETGRGESKNLVCAYFWKGFAAVGWDFAAEQRDQLEPSLKVAELAEARRLIAASKLVDGEVKRPLCPLEKVTISVKNSGLSENVGILRYLTALEIDAQGVPNAAAVELSANLEDTPWEEAFTQLFKSGGLRWMREGNTIKILPLASK